jgi:hypothetical protein
MTNPTEGVYRSVIDGYAYASPSEIESVERQISREADWFVGQPRYTTNGDIIASALNGELIKVEPTPNCRPIARYLMPENGHLYLPYLAPYAALALQLIGDRWRAEADQLGLPKNICLALTSLIRSMVYQQQLCNTPGKLALATSSHTAGGAFDIDCAGYYLMMGADVVPVRLSSVEEQLVMHDHTAQSMGIVATRTLVFGPEHFDPKVKQALMRAVGPFHEANFINVVPEYIGTTNECLHIGVNPRFVDLLPKLPS